MREGSLARHLQDERSLGIRILLARPLLDAGGHPEDFRVVSRNRVELVRWFDQACGWQLTVDVMGGFARLVKRSSSPDPTRPARRSRGADLPFDRRRYQLLCFLCAEISRHPVTTIGILAAELSLATATEPGGRFDPTRRAERAAYVDALRLLESWGVLSFSAGDVDDYVGSDKANAIATVETSRLHRLLASAASPSQLGERTTVEAVAALVTEPRYASADLAAEADRERHHRRLRHALARRILDDPALYAEDLTDDERAYLATTSGRRWLRDRVAEAGFVLEERAEGMLAVDPDGIASDLRFPSQQGGHVAQAALALLDAFVEQAGPSRRLAQRSFVALVEAAAALLRRHRNWAKAYQHPGGAELLAREAVGLLEQLALARRAGPVVSPLPALARYVGIVPGPAQEAMSL